MESSSRTITCNTYRGPVDIAKRYTEDHEAVVYDDATNLGVVSITDYAQSSLGDVVFVDSVVILVRVML